MKKSLMIAIVSVALSLQVSAQDNGTNGPRQFDRNEMIQRRTESTASRYGFDEAQKAKLLELNKKYADVIPMMGPRGGGPGRMGGMRPGRGQSADNNASGDNQNSRPREGMRPGGPRQGFGGGGPGRFRPDPEKMQQYETELQSIMTPEQYAKYQEDRKAMMERMSQRRGEGRPQDRQ